ncbi:carbohydrate kinase family protein [Salinibacterium sp. SWN167]|uniref:carbohydrate kinase family protein n=1 Tax=Salinibacterium sp. SWN167 TaxID=2792054 RepID=UPI0018CF8ECF|nr:carbohydrate kinase family protein [Salinibacterium sp. SWN167]MBH0082673.1 carbohydrate kinase family protein [Salinibacterium sp. SWN167]
MSAQYPVLVVGDANIDLVVRGDVVPRFGQVEQLLEHASLVLGGSACIMASGLAQLGVPTSVVAVIGDDEFGGIMRDSLVSAGVDVSAVHVDPQVPTGISVILSTADDRAILTLPGTVPLLTSAHVLAAVESSQAHWVHFASPFLMPEFTAGLPALLAELKAQGIRTSLDTNWDPADEWAGLGEVLPLIDVLLPNRAELDAITAAVGEIECRVVVKDGAAGGWSRSPDGTTVRAPGIRLDVVDTTGAGDSFDAGYLAAVAHGVADEQTRVRWAAVAGSLSTRASGGTGAQATLAQLREHLA